MWANAQRDGRPAKCSTVIKTTKCRSWVVRTQASQIQHGGRPPSWKNRKIAISRPRFDRFQQNLWKRSSLAILSVATVKIYKIWKCKTAAAAILKNRKIAISRPRFDRFRQNFAWRHSLAILNFLTITLLKFRKSKMAAVTILKNRKIAIPKSPYLSIRLTDLHEILYTDAVGPSWPFRSL